MLPFGTTVGDSYIGQSSRIDVLIFLLCTESLDSKFACEQFQIVIETCSTAFWTHRCGLIANSQLYSDPCELLSGASYVYTSAVVPKVCEVFEMQSMCS